MAARCNVIEVWQRNCRSFRAKRYNLQLHLQILPDSQLLTVIALQETQCKVKLRNYTTHERISQQTPRTAILVHRNYTASKTPLGMDELDGHVLELLPRTRQGRSLFILNVYSPPKSPAGPLIAGLQKTLDISGRQVLVVVGYFNANHTSWGYKNCRKGTTLWTFIQNEGLSLINELDHPTRMGNSIQLITSPDLTLTKNINGSKWSNPLTSLGSDHFIISSEIPTHNLAQRSKRTVEIVDWDKFRVIRTSAPESIADLDSWLDTLTQYVQKATSQIPTPLTQTLWTAAYYTYRRRILAYRNDGSLANITDPSKKRPQH
ncbi:hypothetical protein HPB49_012258 [Dermacentor silvarum]|uniref:Uncharacterized protein n=1 Tax=Dermacentor silvarum TaxID=543639 RepID=A0ACB8D5Q6_DERSI|nr:hypothetical protein HPB49_012258 [Dermacentor silvarum]